MAKVAGFEMSRKTDIGEEVWVEETVELEGVEVL